MPIDETTREKILENLRIGMPLGNVADLVKLSLADIQREMEGVPAFKAAVHQAVAECMKARLEKLEKLENWQALAFMLQSLWPMRFGRSSRGRRRRRPHVPEPLPMPDLNRLTDAEKDLLERLLAKAHERDQHHRGDEHLPVVRGIAPKLLH